MFANAIACGNTFILKPSEKDPSASVYLAELLRRRACGGVFSVVHGDKGAVDAILEHPDIAAVSFVGSTPIARHIYETPQARQAGPGAGRRKNHMVVLPDRVGMAADAAVSAAYGPPASAAWPSAWWWPSATWPIHWSRPSRTAAEGQGRPRQRCRVGDGPSSRASTGTGGRLPGQRRRAGGDPAGGRSRPSAVQRERWLLPGVSLPRPRQAGDGLLPQRDLRPVLEVVRVPPIRCGPVIEENPYANGTAIYTRDGGAARQFQFDINVGMVGINVPIPVPVAYYSFGGWKSSLFGDLHSTVPRHPVLHARQGGHRSVARSVDLEGRLGFAHPMTTSTPAAARPRVLADLLPGPSCATSSDRRSGCNDGAGGAGLHPALAGPDHAADLHCPAGRRCAGTLRGGASMLLYCLPWGRPAYRGSPSSTPGSRCDDRLHRRLRDRRHHRRSAGPARRRSDRTGTIAIMMLGNLVIYALACRG